MFFCAHCAMWKPQKSIFTFEISYLFFAPVAISRFVFFLLLIILSCFFLRFCWFSYFAVALNAYFHMLLSNFTDGFCYSRSLPQLAIGCVYSGLCSVLCVLGDLGTGSPIRMRTYSRFGFPRELCKYVFVWLADFC